jgi:hypothetical protein
MEPKVLRELRAPKELKVSKATKEPQDFKVFRVLLEISTAHHQQHHLRFHLLAQQQSQLELTFNTLLVKTLWLPTTAHTSSMELSLPTHQQLVH